MVTAIKRGSLASQLAMLSQVAPEAETPNPAGDPRPSSSPRASAAATAAAEEGSGPDEAADTDEAGEDEADQAGSKRSHYVDVAPSARRRRAQLSESEALRDVRYAGVRARAVDFFGDDDDADEIGDGELDGEESKEGESIRDESELVEDDEQEDEESDEMDEESDEMDGGTGDGDDGLHDSTEQEEAGGSEEESESSSDEGDVDRPPTNAPKKTPAKKQLRFAEPDGITHSAARGLAAEAQEDAKLVDTLREQSYIDAERGRGVKRQMQSWEKALGLRIRCQKLVHGVGRIDSKSIMTLLDELGDRPKSNGSHHDTLKNLMQACDDLLALRLHTLEVEHHGDVLVTEALNSDDGKLARDLSQSRKRKHSEGGGTISHNDSDHLDAVRACLALESATDSLHRAILDKWSTSTSTTQSGGGKAKVENRFDASSVSGSGLKAVNQSVNAQVDRAMEGDGMERLVKRSRHWRSDESRIGTSISPSTHGEADAHTNGAETQNHVEDDEVFDDTDFYQQLLRELIESKGADGASAGAINGGSTVDWAAALKKHAKKTKKVVDTRASKGRKLRYEVIEKIQNFMPPIPTETWSEEQIVRLFSQLGGAAPASADRDGGTTEEPRGPADVGAGKAHTHPDLSGFRLFA